LLAAERKRPGQQVFSSTMDVKFSSQKLSMRYLATYAPVPLELRSFIEGLVQPLPPLVFTLMAGD
jgi:hypothetical protein